MSAFPSTQYATYIPPAPKNGFGITALVLGIIAVLIAFIPILSLFVSIPLGLVGILFAILGFVRISKGTATYRAMTAIGMALSVLAIIISVISTAFTAAFFKSLDDSKDSGVSVESAAGSDNSGDLSNSEDSDAPASDPVPTAAGDQFPGQQPDDVVAQAGDKVTVDGVEITVSELKKDSDSLSEYLCTDISIANNSSENYSYNEFDWKVQTPGGVVDGTTIALVDYTLGSGKLVPGGKVSGKACFELTKETKAKGQYIVLNEDDFSFSSDRIAWIDER